MFSVTGWVARTNVALDQLAYFHNKVKVFVDENIVSQIINNGLNKVQGI